MKKLMIATMLILSASPALAQQQMTDADRFRRQWLAFDTQAGNVHQAAEMAIAKLEAENAELRKQLADKASCVEPKKN